MFKNLPTASVPFVKVFNKKKIIGYVDLIEWSSIQGWVLRNERSSITLALQVEENSYPLDTQWLVRLDVAEKHGKKFINSGYHCALTAELEDVLRNAVLRGQKVEVLADGVVLENLARLPKLIEQLEPEILGMVTETVHPQLEQLGSEIDAFELKGEIEQWGHFIISGWVTLNERPVSSVSLLCNGNSLDCTVLRVKRPDISQTMEGNSVEIGFRIELPGYLWESVSQNEDAQIEILINGKSLELAPLVLSIEKAVRWIEDITSMIEGPDKQYYMLLALEHIRYGGLMPLLQRTEALFVREFAKNMQLEEFVLDKAATQSKSEVPIESFETLLLWRSLQVLNTDIEDGQQPVFDRVKSLMKKLRLEKGMQEKFIFSITPLLCKTGEFMRLRELIDFGCLQGQGNFKDNVACLTLALPAFIADKLVNEATQVLYAIATGLDKGWLNTECIRFSVQTLQRMEVKGEVEILVAEKFRYAVIGLLDAFHGEWFSRLHDQNLIETMLLMLSDIDWYTDYHRHDMVMAAQRIYGLNPAFWECAVRWKLSSLDNELARSHAHFKKLYSALTASRTSLEVWNDDVVEPLAFFRSKNNPEAVIFQREICANHLPYLNDILPMRAKALISKLLATDSREALRIAAFPLATENRLVENFPETLPGLLRETLRRLSEPSKSVAWHLQENASAALLSLLQTDAGDLSQMKQALAIIEQRAMSLANWQAGFLAFDLLASSYLVASRHGLEGTTLITLLLRVLKKCVEETRQDWYLPAPVMAGLNRLGADRKKTDPLLQGFLAESYKMIRGKFGSRLDVLLELPDKLTLRLSSFGWPQDTLVVIYSCRKYLDSRVKSIRETWVQDLKARNIPYLVLVGDGDDTIKGDVLSLNISDKYEDLPKKSLKLFDWVYHNTNAQYVLKIDDDCYLDVPRFFDTLSYRKHFYYGRVIRRRVGSMDRAWHQSKSHTLHSRKTIDKSPEPSIYADGGGGYTLSRLAMQRLLEAQKTQLGMQLMACSFMEDKLIGDLLAASYIEPSNEDYDSYQRRRTFGEAIPVGMWENTFFPSRSSPTKVVHLDNHLDLAYTREKADSNELWPKKLWPTCCSPSLKLGYQVSFQLSNNQLELLTDTKAAKTLLNEELVVVSVVRNEMVLLPHFLEHYRGLGVKCFVIVDNCSDDGSREYLFEQPDVILYSADTDYKYSYFGVAWQQAVLGNLCLGKWVLLADADEFLVYENSESRSIHDFVEDISAEACNSVCTVMVDMYPAGDLSEANFTQGNPFDLAPWFDNPPVVRWRLGSGWFSNSKSTVSHLRHRLVKDAEPNNFISQKYALFRYFPWVRVSQGLHYASNLTISSRPSWFAHFKYHSGLKEKVEIEIRRGQHYNNAAEYRRYALMLAEGQGGFRKNGVSKRFTTSADFVS